MKNLVLASILVIGSLINLQAGNSPTSTTLSTVSGEKSVVLNLDNKFSATDLFTITDSNGKNVFTDLVEKYENSIKYNLEKLPIGEYTINIQGEDFIEYYETTITNEQVFVKSSESFYKPVINSLNTKVIVSDPNSSKEDIQVSIYNAKGELLYDFNDTKIGSYKKMFNLEHLDSGNYNLIVSTDHFTESIKVSL